MFSGFDHVLSLGWVCNVGNYLSAVKSQPLGVFDRIATPMWAVSDLVANDFDSFLTNMTTGAIYADNDKTFSYDTKYFIRTLATNPDSPGFAKFRDALTAQAQTFLDLIKTENAKILFIRTEEPATDIRYGTRAPPAEFAQKYAQPELFYLQHFAQFLKNVNPSLQFKILYLSSQGQFVDAEDHIIGIPAPSVDYRDSKAISDMIQTVKNNEEYILQNL